MCIILSNRGSSHQVQQPADRRLLSQWCDHFSLCLSLPCSLFRSQPAAAPPLLPPPSVPQSGSQSGGGSQLGAGVDNEEVWQAVLEVRPYKESVIAMLQTASKTVCEHFALLFFAPRHLVRGAPSEPAPPSRLAFSTPLSAKVAAAMDLFGEDGPDELGREGWECQYCGRQFPFEHLALMQECEMAHERAGEIAGAGQGHAGQRTPRPSMSADPYDHQSVSLQASPSHAALASVRGSRSAPETPRFCSQSADSLMRLGSEPRASRFLLGCFLFLFSDTKRLLTLPPCGLPS